MITNSRTRLIPEHHRTAACHRTGCGQAGLHTRYLARTRFTAKLLHDLNHVIEPMSVAFRQEAAVGIERQRAVAGDASALHKGAALAFFAELQTFKLHDDAVREAVVDLGDVDILRPHA